MMPLLGMSLRCAPVSSRSFESTASASDDQVLLPSSGSSSPEATSVALS
eukprot:CAMPEP_0177401468 /NCGR_PEP_ID=MMETSP0368-20130122/59661_1 /TAXON_ID=447022 ORGANISM="Scrippsiella hangoei-like, Strain SHHI-4" /NCGR_SAMPLE_ID=MMETSP0368 /ASSEMBLY_ACC=CAM_ASM_000363 /LENGTH=48 /DNA_ID= /DNA_START= /DNA_END= /DNA_ORIENTATION=